jgi:hypothetical protein
VLTLGLSQPIEEDRLAPFRAIHPKNAEGALRILTEGGVAALLLGPCTDLLHDSKPQILRFTHPRTCASAYPAPKAGRKGPGKVEMDAVTPRHTPRWPSGRRLIHIPHPAKGVGQSSRY